MKLKSYCKIIEAENLPELTWATAPAADVDIVLGEPSRIKAALASLPALSWVQSIWAGIEPLVGPAARRDYILTNARGVFGGLMSEYVIGYLLAHERKILKRLEDQKNKSWDESDTGTLRGKTIGLLGVGSIGAEVARTAKFFGMNVRGYTRGSETSEHVDEYFHGDDLFRVLLMDWTISSASFPPHWIRARSSTRIYSTHCPLTQSS